MSKLTALVSALLLLASSASAQVATQTFTVQQPGMPTAPVSPPRDPQATPTGTASIRGRVFAADTGAPLRRARVFINSPELRVGRSTSTDAQGRYEIKELPAGRYLLNASKGSYVSLQYGQTRPTEPGKPLQILDNQTVQKVDFALPRGAIVTGRILDEFGDPASDVMVMPMRYQFFNGRRRLVPAGRPAQTNDVGEYRMYGLPPGQYYLSATLRSFTPGESDDRSGYAPTYYPGSSSMSDAQRITLATAQELPNINFALVPTRTAQITGTAVDTAGKPMAGAMIAVTQTTGGNFMMTTTGGTQVKPDGSFVVSNVAPGEYRLTAMFPSMLGGEGDTASAAVTVAGEDITGVRLQASSPAIITGQIVLEDAMPNERVLPSMFQLVALPATPDETAPFEMPGRTKINDDWTFETKARTDKVLLRSAGRSPSGWVLKAVLRDGIDATDKGLEVRQGETTGGVMAVFTKKRTTVQGQVTTDRDQPARDYSVVIFPDDRDRWTFESRYVGVGRPDQDGKYKVTALPPGEYLAVAVEYLERGQEEDPEFLEKMRPRGTRFTLAEGETKVLDLKLLASGT